MAPKTSHNPIAFTSWPVAFFTVSIFTALFACLITVHNVVPPAPKNPTPIPGINLTEAWFDLEVLTNGYHPYNSKRNDEIRNWLLNRIETILKRNGVSPVLISGNNAEHTADSPAVIYNDVLSNLTFSSSDSALSVAFTGTNIMVYIRGSDDIGRWWDRSPTNKSLLDYEATEVRKGGVLVNAHFDSVPSGYGATDDGVGVITVLQLISYFTTPGNTPKRGVVALLNNGEEDYLNGAYAFSQSPISQFPHTFLNLEGAGAGGRAVLFRSSDAEVTRFYKKSPHPFGSVVSVDGFKRGLVRSQTDYVVFNGDLGMRGLDVAFMEPRARYHTQEDDTRHTSMRSLWHMLSASVATMQGLASDTSSKFDGIAAGKGKVESGEGSDAVWFDLFGQVFAVFELHTLFAVSVTLLVTTPLVLIGLTILLVKLDKWYLFSGQKILLGAEGPVHFHGWRAIFRYPIAFIVSTAGVVGLAFLVTKMNPYIVYSSEYSLWSMMLTAWFFVMWFLLRGADSMRPSALQRMTCLIWQYVGGWLILVGVTIGENYLHLAGGYFMVIYFAAIFTALVISYLELLALPKKSAYADMIVNSDLYSNQPTQGSASSTHLQDDNDNDEASERTSLLRGDRQRTYASGYGTRSRSAHGSGEILDHDHEEEASLKDFPSPYGDEQGWSGKLPSWTWLPQFLILGPVPIVFLGQVGLLMTSALRQTPADGNSVLTIYLFLALLSVLLLAPVTPFIHRFHYSIPTLLLTICIGTVLYNLLAFPFSEQARLKVYFLQTVNLDTGINKVSLTGLPPYVNKIIDSIPSSSGRYVNCSSPEYSARRGLTKCSWEGLTPNVLNQKTNIPPKIGYGGWLRFNVSRTANTSEARFHIAGRNTRACRILFDKPIRDFSVKGYATDPRFPHVGKKGCQSIRLWTREWGGAWDVDVKWDGPNGLDGRVVCLWSDANDPATIPAFEEVRRYMPAWSVATKLSDGLVEGYKVFNV